MNHPFKPMLYADPVVDIPYDRWDRAHIWLNKQPFFLWPAAFFFNIFGVNEVTLRIPSALEGSILVFLAFRTGKLLISERTGYYSAFLVATAFYMVEIISGRQELEHNDIAFLVWVSASIWAWVEYLRSGKRRWIVLIGIFSGVAILVKWLVGLLVYLGWVFYIVITPPGHRRKEILRLIISVCITIAIALPWYAFILLKYPMEAMVTLNLYTAHLTRPLDGHGGDFWFHFNNIALLYGTIVPFIIIPAWWILYQRITPKSLAISLIFMILVVYLFFSFAKTKMPSLPWVASLPLYLTLGCLVDYFITRVNTIKASRLVVSASIFILLVLIGFYNLRIPTILDKHTKDVKRNVLLANLQHNKMIFLDLPSQLPDNSVVFNVKGRHYIECMFYSGFPSYPFIPSKYQILNVCRQGRAVAIFQSPIDELPDYILKNPAIIIIQQELLGWD
ncbi:MAG: glycosyltransferase family 39 protein [bacterium]